MEPTAHEHGRPAQVDRLAAALGIVALLLAAEVITANLSHSLALFGDAGHLLTDVASLGLAIFAVQRGRRRANSRHTFGHLRSGILVAAINGLVLLALAVGLVLAAVSRLVHPTPVSAAPVIAVAAIAVAVNGSLVALLRNAGTELSVRSALLHIVADAVAAAGVLISGLVILATGWQAADPVVSILIAGLIAFGAFRLLNEARLILGEGTPPDLDAQGVRRAILGVHGVDGVHDLHIWSLDRSHRALSAHISVADRPLAEVTAVLRDVETRLCAEFGIEHATLQPECPACVAGGDLFCDLDERHNLVHQGAAASTEPSAPSGPRPR